MIILRSRRNVTIVDWKIEFVALATLFNARERVVPRPWQRVAVGRNLSGASRQADRATADGCSCTSALRFQWPTISVLSINSLRNRLRQLRFSTPSRSSQHPSSSAPLWNCMVDESFHGRLAPPTNFVINFDGHCLLRGMSDEFNSPGPGDTAQILFSFRRGDGRATPSEGRETQEGIIGSPDGVVRVHQGVACERVCFGKEIVLYRIFYVQGVSRKAIWNIFSVSDGARIVSGAARTRSKSRKNYFFSNF